MLQLITNRCTMARIAGSFLLAAMMGACAAKFDISSSVVIPANDAARLQFSAPFGAELTLRNDSAQSLPIEVAQRQDQAAGLFIGNTAERLESRVTRRWKIEGSRIIFIRNGGSDSVEVAYRFKGKGPLDIRVSPRPVEPPEAASAPVAAPAATAPEPAAPVPPPPPPAVEPPASPTPPLPPTPPEGK